MTRLTRTARFIADLIGCAAIFVMLYLGLMAAHVFGG